MTNETNYMVLLAGSKIISSAKARALSPHTRHERARVIGDNQFTTVKVSWQKAKKILSSQNPGFAEGIETLVSVVPFTAMTNSLYYNGTQKNIWSMDYSSKSLLTRIFLNSF